MKKNQILAITSIVATALCAASYFLWFSCAKKSGNDESTNTENVRVNWIMDVYSKIAPSPDEQEEGIIYLGSRLKASVYSHRSKSLYVRYPLTKAVDAIITGDDSFDVLIHCANSVARIDRVGSGQCVWVTIKDTAVVDGVRWINVHVDVIPYYLYRP